MKLLSALALGASISTGFAEQNLLKKLVANKLKTEGPDYTKEWCWGMLPASADFCHVCCDGSSGSCIARDSDDITPEVVKFGGKTFEVDLAKAACEKCFGGEWGYTCDGQCYATEHRMIGDRKLCR